ncbi:MAG: CapA family protein [Firmicutes bacterium]|nr:CapA family protein [Bacillota bacterium]
MRKGSWKCGALFVCCLLLAGCRTPENQMAAGSKGRVEAGEESPESSRNVAEMAPEAGTGDSGPSTSDGGSTETEENADPAGVSGGLPESVESAEPQLHSDFSFTLCFAGDVNLDESWATTQFMDSQENGIYDCISPELIEYMNNADIMCLNNEFTYSTGGTPLEGKVYTFRAAPERVEVLHQLGVDAVTLANNHVYDYGKEALLDTFAVLEEAEIPYFGAGRDLEQAMSPLYMEVDGKTVALVGASRAEKYKMTPQATETEPGILRCYDTSAYREAIAEAKANADFCIAFVHWGTEYSYELEQVQLDTGKEYLDAGADAVIGAHSHCLQGLEYYDGKPIIYSLGNYWFNNKTLDTMLVLLHISGNEEETSIQVEIVPAVQSGCRTIYAGEEEERQRIFDFLESISVNIEITEEGIVKELSN